MRVVDSNITQLSQEEVLYVVGENIGFTKDCVVEIAEALEAIDRSDDFVQLGNTLFIYSMLNDRASGQVFNADTGRNFINNCKNYFARLQQKGVQEFEATADCSISKCLKIFQRLLSNTDSNLRTFDMPNKSFMLLQVGKEGLGV